jgi:hypothetical protein
VEKNVREGTGCLANEKEHDTIILAAAARPPRSIERNEKYGFKV